MFSSRMTTMTLSPTPCELILKVGSNECEEISTAIASLLRTCSISEQTFFVLERQIQPTTYFGSFTPHSSTSVPIPSQSLSCVLLLTDDILKQQQLVRPLPSSTKKNNAALLPKSKHFFKSPQIWNFHHKIELLDEHKQAIARQDYYELSHHLPLWSVSHIPHSRQPIVRFNIFTQHFESLLTFYTRLFHRQPDSSKAGFALFILATSPQVKIIYQFSIKYSPSIQPYSIAQSAYLKFRLSNLHHFLPEYSSKLFTLNKYEYYIYDPDGNLLHLHLFDRTPREEMPVPKSIPHPIDSGVGESSDPPTTKQIFSSTVPQGYKPFYPINVPPADIDVQSHSSQSSHDSGRWSSISSNELNAMKRTVQQIPITVTNSTPRSAARMSELQLAEAINNYRQQQQRTVLPRLNSRRTEPQKPTLYESEPRLAPSTSVTNRYYSSMSDVQSSLSVRSSKPTLPLQSINDYECDISYEVDSPRQSVTETSSVGYLNAFLLKKRQESIRSHNVQQLIARFDPPRVLPSIRRPLSAPLVDLTSKPTKGILQRRSNGSITPVPNKSLRKRSKSVTFECHSDDESTSSTDDEKIESRIDPSRSPRINIGITLDSRLRKTPALEMLRSTTMQPDTLSEPKQINRTSSLRQSFIPIARF